MQIRLTKRLRFGLWRKASAEAVRRGDGRRWFTDAGWRMLLGVLFAAMFVAVCSATEYVGPKGPSPDHPIILVDDSGVWAWIKWVYSRARPHCPIVVVGSRSEAQ